MVAKCSVVTIQACKINISHGLVIQYKILLLIFLGFSDGEPSNIKRSSNDKRIIRKSKRKQQGYCMSDTRLIGDNQTATS